MYEVTYINAFGQLCAARYSDREAAYAGFRIARNMHARLWVYRSRGRA